MIKRLVMILSIFMLSASVNATPIVGSILWTGHNWEENAGTFSFQGSNYVTLASQDFASIPLFTNLPMADINTLNLGTGVVLWEWSGFKFVLKTVNATQIAVLGMNWWMLDGAGVISHANYEDRIVRFFLSANPGHPNNYSAAVPEPGSLGLIGLGILVLGLTARKKR